MQTLDEYRWRIDDALAFARRWYGVLGRARAAWTAARYSGFGGLLTLMIFLYILVRLPIGKSHADTWPD